MSRLWGDYMRSWGYVWAPTSWAYGKFIL